MPFKFDFMNRYAISFLILSIFIFTFSVSCSGNYYGIDGSDVYTRDESIQILSTAQFIYYQNCSNRKAADSLFLDLAITNPRMILDSAYYSKKDIHYCEETILLAPCNLPLVECQIAPEEFFNGNFGQGGF